MGHPAGKSVELIEDATIAATARVHGLSVATPNDSAYTYSRSARRIAR